MQAVTFTEYGSPDVLKIQEVEKPIPQDNEVLIKVHAASANPLDWHLMRGELFLGRVEAVGKNSTAFQIGNEVFGELFEHGLGAFAEYVTAPADIIALKPANISFETAAVPIASLTVLQGLRKG